ncbi:MAG TPA: hypothetical protein VIF37_17010 [Methylobacter sp.]|jgi:ribosomal protein L40E
MEPLFNILINFLLYISIPIAIRYAILRRPLRSKWIAVIILLPIFVAFATLIGNQREEGQKRIYEQAGITYRSTPHMIGSPILYAAMALSYFILRRGHAKKELTSDESMTSTNEKGNRPTICSKCMAEVSTDLSYCHHCGSKIAEMNNRKYNDYSIFMALIKHPIVFIFGGGFFTVVAFMLFLYLVSLIVFIPIRIGQMGGLLILLFFPAIGRDYVNFYVRNGLGIVWLSNFIRNFYLR